MITERQQSISLAAFYLRVQGFVKDGYWKSFEVIDKSFCFVKLVHKNGNRVSLKLDLQNGNISQLTNGKETSCHSMC